jgi:hypothetical protein
MSDEIIGSGGSQVCCDECSYEGCGEEHFEMSIDGTDYILKSHLELYADHDYLEPCDGTCGCEVSQDYKETREGIESRLREKISKSSE